MRRRSKQEMQKNTEQTYFCEQMFCGDVLYQVKEPSEMQQKLHRYIGVVLAKSRVIPGDGKGTGFLISPNLVLTVAHNIYNKYTGEVYHSIKFFPCQQGKLQQHFDIEDFYFPGIYTNISGPATHDFALLKIKGKINQQDFLTLNGAYQQLNKKSKLSIFGYPAQKYTQQSKEEDLQAVNQWGVVRQDRIVDIRQSKGEILHHISTLRGHSGSPIIKKQSNGQLSIIGIHKGEIQTMVSGQKTDANAGRLITPEFIKILQAGAKALGAQPFQVKFPMKDEKDEQILRLKEELRKIQVQNRALYQQKGKWKNISAMIEQYQMQINQLKTLLQKQQAKVNQLLQHTQNKLSNSQQDKRIQGSVKVEGQSYSQVATQLASISDKHRVNHLSISVFPKVVPHL